MKRKRASLGCSGLVAPLALDGSRGKATGATHTVPGDDSERLEEAQARLAAIINCSDDAIVSKTLDGVITSWNQAAERILGYSAEEAVGRHIGLIIPEDRREEENEVLARLRRGERIDHFETQRQTKDGRRIDISLTVSPIKNAEGRIIGASKVARDISERKRVEAAMRDAERRKDEFLATLSHELRNPLAPIRNAVELLSAANADPSVISEAQRILARQVAHLSRLVDDLMELSRVNTGIITLRKEALNLSDVVASAVETSRSGIDSAGHQLHVVVAKEPLMLMADSVRINQVLSNLLNNAARYTPPGGRIELSAKPADGEQVLISVRDNGIGIEAEMVPRIFEMFTQGKERNRPAKGGLGIGLWLARRLVELHDGSLEVHSEGRGKGSEFVVRLPAWVTSRARPGARPERARSSDAFIAARRVLVVDDNVDAAESLGLVLRAMGHDVRVVHNGQAAIEAASALPPEIVLLDISMPEVDGYAVAERMRSDKRLKGVRIVALTGHGMEEDRRRSRNAGFDQHLLKPVLPEMLAAVLAGTDPAPDAPENSAAH